MRLTGWSPRTRSADTAAADSGGGGDAGRIGSAILELRQGGYFPVWSRGRCRCAWRLSPDMAKESPL